MPRFLSLMVVLAVLTGLVAFSGDSSATPSRLAASPLASPQAGSPLLATMQAKQSATADSKTATADVHAGETATAQAAANAQATDSALTTTAAVGTTVANAVAIATENAELQDAIVGAA